MIKTAFAALLSCAAFIGSTQAIANLRTSRKLATQHDNFFYIYTSGVKSMTCSASSPIVSSGQPAGAASASFNGGTLTVMVQAGRQNSQGPAQGFMSGLGPNNVLGDNTSSSQPSELNFYITMNCQVTGENGSEYNLNDLHVGQGNENSNNNWWIGQSGCDKEGSDLYCAGNALEFGSGSVDKMTLTVN